MSETVERGSFDLRYESYRLRNDAAEARLLVSIAERGIQQPLRGVEMPPVRVLLDGFKRVRCATKLHIECVPYVCLAGEEATGIARLLRADRQQSLSILEQARFVSELLSTHGLSVAEVAEMLSRSKAWVSLRHSLLKELSPPLQEILLRGRFPVYSYMTTLRPFMRINGIGRDEVERFVQAVAGQRLSVREIALLAKGYFRGPASLRQAIHQGKWKWSLQQMQSGPDGPDACNDVERAVLRDLERLLKSMQGLMTRCDSPRLQTGAFHAQANLLVASLLARRESFFNKLEEFYDRSGREECYLPVTSSRDVAAGDQPPPAGQSQCRAEDHQAAGTVGSPTAERQEAD